MRGLRLLIADDHRVIRESLRMVLESQTGWAIVSEAVNGREAVAMAQDSEPDVAVLDISMPELDGFEAAKQIRDYLPKCEILMVSVHDSPHYVTAAFKAGARGFVLKADAGRELVPAIKAVLQKKTFRSARLPEDSPNLAEIPEETRLQSRTSLLDFWSR